VEVGVSNVAIEFKMDADYFDEFHREWIEAVGRGWRIDRVMKPVFLVVGLVLAVVAAVKSNNALLVPGVMCCGFAVLEHVKGIRKKAKWLAHSLSLPWSGKTMRMGVEDRTLVHKNEFEGAPRFERIGELLDTPNGYLLRYECDGIEVPDSAISGISASVYIPQRAIQPAMTRAEFRALLVS